MTNKCKHTSVRKKDIEESADGEYMPWELECKLCGMEWTKVLNMSDLEIKADKALAENKALSNDEIKELKEDRDDALKAVMERKVFLAEKYVEPHTKISRRCKEEDLPFILEEAAIMHEMCMVGRGDFSTAFAIAHPQVHEDPLRFFVNSDGQIFINPVIVDKGHEIVTVQEGCMSYPEEPFKTLVRYKQVTVRYRTVGHKEDRKTGENLGQYYLTKEVQTEFKGSDAQVMQHECQHLNGSDIYQPDTSPNKAFYEPIIKKENGKNN